MSDFDSFANRFDDLVSSYEQPVEERGFAGDVGSAAMRGVGGALSQIGGGLQAPEYSETNQSPVSRFGQWVERKGGDIIRKYRPDSGDGDSWLKKQVLSGVESVPGSLTPWVVGALGSAIAGPEVGIPLGTATLGEQFGGGTWKQRMDQLTVHAPDMPYSKKNELSWMDAGIETGGEAASDLIASYTVGLLGHGTKGLEGGIKSLLKSSPKELLTRVAGGYAAEEGTEAGQAYYQSMIDQFAGTGDALTFTESIKQTAIPTGIVFLAIGGGAGGINAYHKKQIINALTNEKAKDTDRIGAYQFVADRIKDPELKDAWAEYAGRKIVNGQPIDLNFTGKSDPTEVTDNLKTTAKKLRTETDENGFQTVDQVIKADELDNVADTIQATHEPYIMPDIEDDTQYQQPESKGPVFDLATPQLQDDIIGSMVDAQQQEDIKANRRKPQALPPGQGFEIVSPEESQTRLDKQAIDSGVLGQMRKDAAGGEVGQRFKKDSGYGPDENLWDGVKSTNPDWLKNNPTLKSAGKKTIFRVMQLKEDGKTLTPRQQEIWDELQKEAKREENENPEFAAAVEGQRIENEEGINIKPAPEKVAVGELNKGDKVVVKRHGIHDVLEHKGVDGNGNAILKDGETIVADPFEVIDIYGKKEGTLEQATQEQQAGKTQTTPEKSSTEGAKVNADQTRTEVGTPGQEDMAGQEPVPETNLPAGESSKEIEADTSDRVENIKGLDLRYDGKQEGFGPVKSSHQITILSGPAEGTTLSVPDVEESTIREAVKKKESQYSKSGDASTPAGHSSPGGVVSEDDKVEPTTEKEWFNAVKEKYDKARKLLTTQINTNTEKSLNNYFAAEKEHAAIVKKYQKWKAKQNKADSPRVKTVTTPGANPSGADSNAVLFSDASPGDLLVADREVYLVKKGIKTKREAEKLAGETGGRVVLDRKKWAVVSDNKPTPAVSTQGAGPEIAHATKRKPAHKEKTDGKKIQNEAREPEGNNNRDNISGNKASIKEVRGEKRITVNKTELPNKDGIRKFSSTTTPTGTTVSEAQQEAESFLGRKVYDKVINDRTLRIIQTTDAPKEHLDKFLTPRGDKIAGYYHGPDGSITLIADHIKKGSVSGVLLHEFVHKLLHADPRFQEDRAKILDSISQDNSRAVKAARARAIEAEGKDADPDLIAEETLTYLMESKAEQKTSIIRRVIAAVRRALRRIGLPVGKYSHDELVQLFKAGIKKNALGKSKVNEFAPSLAVSFSKAKKSILDNPKFREWFGDSKVVDEDGDPLVVYHGTVYDFNSFSKDKVKNNFPQSFGFHFTDRPTEASVYASSPGYNDEKALLGAGVYPVYLKAENPLEIKTEYVSASMEADLERSSIIRKLARAKRNGKPYDAVIITAQENDPEWSGKNVIVFSPAQIKSIFNSGEFSPTNPDIRYSIASDIPTADEYELNRETKGSLKLKVTRNMKALAHGIAAGSDKYLGAISTRLKNINPKLQSAIRELDFKIGTKHAEDIKAVEGMLKKAKSKMSNADFKDWDYARKNSDKAKIDELVKKYDLEKEYKSYRNTLNIIHKEAEGVGLDIGFIEEYAPRILKDHKGFLNEIGKGDDWSVISMALVKKAKDLGIDVVDMTPEMKADIISNMLYGGNYGYGAGPSGAKERTISKITPDINQYYMDSDSALVSYLHSMRKAIEQRKFFGKVPDTIKKAKENMHRTQALIRNELAKDKPDQNMVSELRDNEKLYRQLLNKYRYSTNDYTENIGQYVLDLLSRGEINPSQEREIIDIMTARFHERGTRGLIQAYKNFSYIDTMGSPISALTQIGDLAWSAYENGLGKTLKNVYKSIRKTSRITKEDVGIERIAQEFADSDTLSNMVGKVFKMVGLEYIDAIGKESMLNSSLEKYEKLAKSNPEKLAKDIKHIFESETKSVIEDLQNGDITDNVKLLVYNKLLDYQPVALSEMPEQYLRAGNGRLFYMLKSYTLKQFDVYRREVYNGLKSGNKKEVITSLQNLATLSMFIVMANAGADELKDFVLNRDTTLSDRVTDNILRLFGVSKFITWKARTDGLGSALTRQILPPFKFIDSVTKDLVSAGDDKGLYVTKSIPLVGKLAYWHMGRGSYKRLDLWDHRLSTERKRLNKIKDRVSRHPREKYKYAKELRHLKQLNKFQGKLNKNRAKINRLLASGKKTEIIKRRVKVLREQRIRMIRAFLHR